MSQNFSFSAACRSDLELMPIERASTLHAQWYALDEILKLEQKKIFEHNWQYAGPNSFIQELGAFYPVDVACRSILLTRDLEGKINAFHNICRHRGGPIATAPGKGRILRCQYHGWSYKQSGELIGTPSFDGVQDFDPKCFGLRKVDIHDWHGLLFVRLSSNGPAFASSFSNVATREDTPADISTLRFFRRDVYSVKCNWKVYVDNFLEGYHVGMVHPELATVLDTSNYRSDLSDEWSLQHSPIQDRPNPYTNGSGSAHYYFVFPNLMLNLVPGRLQVNSIIPRGTDQCDVVFDYFYAEIDPEKVQEQAKKDAEFSDLVQKQDISICESVQRSLASGFYERGRYSVQEEKSLHHFHEWYRKLMLRLA